METVLLAMSEVCSNPLCKNPVVTHPKAIHPRRFCSDQCRLDHWTLRRVAEMLLPLGPAKGWEILQGLGNGDTEDKAGGEIVNPGVNLGEIS